MGFATRLNLRLALPGSRRRDDELSDLDCVGLGVQPDFAVRIVIADCKSGTNISASGRMFWLAGARQYFSADRAYVVLSREIADSVREQAGRLSLDVLGTDDLAILRNTHAPGSPPNAHAPDAPIFEVAGVQRLQQLANSLDGRLDSLVRFRDHEYWRLPPERRIQRLVVELRRVGEHLDQRQRGHVVLVLDILFLFALALLGACRRVSAIALSDPRAALLEHLLGGPEQTRARQQGLQDLQRALRALRESGVGVPDGVLDNLTVAPGYFDDLAETVARLLRRPLDARRVLRFVEWWGEVQVGLDGPPPSAALGPEYDGYTRKLVSDVARSCFSAAGLDEAWLELAAAAGNGGLPTTPPSGAASPPPLPSTSPVISKSVPGAPAPAHLPADAPEPAEVDAQLRIGSNDDTDLLADA